MQKITNQEIQTKLNALVAETKEEDMALNKEDVALFFEAQECEYLSLKEMTFTQLQEELVKYKERLSTAQTLLVVLQLSKDASFLDVSMLMDSINEMMDEKSELLMATKTTLSSDTQSVALFEMYVK